MTEKPIGQNPDPKVEILWQALEDKPVASGLMENPLDMVAGSKSNVRRLLAAVACAAAAIIAFAGFYFAGAHFSSETCLACGENGKSSFVLPDSSTVWLNSDSRLYYSGKLNGRQRKLRLEGEAYFKVKRDERRPFIVGTDKMNVEVLGTVFTVTAYEGRPFSACLAEGSVRVSGPGLGEIVLKPGELISETASGDGWELTGTRTGNYTDWADTRLIFDELPLPDIIESLAHWYNVRFAWSPGLDCGDTRLSLTVRNEPLEEILDAVSTLSGIGYRIDGSHILLFRN
ncbi:MAG: FecR family protein [Candidatus Cryptobacteroides sp.]